MSGPKDFIVLFAAARLVQIEARRYAERQARKAAAEARRVEQRRIAEKRMAEMAARRAAIEAEARRRATAAQADLAKQRSMIAQQTAERREQVQATSERQQAVRRSKQTDSVSPETDVEMTSPAAATAAVSAALEMTAATIDLLTELADVEAGSAAQRLSKELEEVATVGGSAEKKLAAIQSEATKAYEDATDRAKRLAESLEQLLCWQTEMSSDDAVIHFCVDRAKAWQSQAEALVQDHSTGHAADVLLVRCQKLLAEAEQIQEDAGAKQTAFATRNELLADVVTSLQEIGFFVSDPQYENPDDPAGPVLVKATRGSEEVSATVDLTDTIRSTWNGIGDEHCKDAFFQYVDRMQAKGIEVKPTRRDLQDRPKLKQKGARSVPDSGRQHRR